MKLIRNISVDFNVKDKLLIRYSTLSDTNRKEVIYRLKNNKSSASIKGRKH
jgi:hypothetical protein